MPVDFVVVIEAIDVREQFPLRSSIPAGSTHRRAVQLARFFRFAPHINL